jgi:hypothetical protein
MRISGFLKAALAGLVVTFAFGRALQAQDVAPAKADNLWDLARSKQQIHRFSTLFTAHQVRQSG